MLGQIRLGAAVFAAVLVVLTACGSGTPQPPSPPSKLELAGRWCGEPGEVLTLDAADGFSLEGASAVFVDALLAEDGYVDGYRVRTEFGGVRPTSVAGTWTILDGPSEPALMLRLDRIGDRKVDEGYGLGVVYGKDGWSLEYPTDPADPDEGAPMRRCDVTTSPTG